MRSIALGVSLLTLIGFSSPSLVKSVRKTLATPANLVNSQKPVYNLDDRYFHQASASERDGILALQEQLTDHYFEEAYVFSPSTNLWGGKSVIKRS